MKQFNYGFLVLVMLITIIIVMLFSTPVEELAEQPIKEPKETVTKIDKTELLSEYLTKEIQLIVARGTISHIESEYENTWKPFDGKTLVAYYLYEYKIIYELSNCEVTKIGDITYIRLVNTFTYDTPARIEEHYTVDKKPLSGNFSEDVFEDISKSGRESALAEIKSNPTHNYRKSTETLITKNAKMYGIKNIKFIWKAVE